MALLFKFHANFSFKLAALKHHPPFYGNIIFSLVKKIVTGPRNTILHFLSIFTAQLVYKIWEQTFTLWIKNINFSLGHFDLGTFQDSGNLKAEFSLTYIYFQWIIENGQ